MINLSHALIEKQPESAKRHGKVILLYDNAPSHTSKLAKDTLRSLGWDILPPLLPLRINGTCAYRAALQQFERSWKMAQRMFCRKTKTFFFCGEVFITYLKDGQSA
jgi:hypothetical protein